MTIMLFLGKTYQKEDFLRRVGRIEQIAGVRPSRLLSGKSDGIKIWDVTTGSGLEFSVMENKCLDLLSLKYRGINLCFLSKPGAVSPEYFNVHGMEFGRYFHGGLYTCGLGNIGESCVDGETEYNWHGRISQTPAENFSAFSGWNGDEYQITLFGEMHEAAHSHENLVLKRTISTKLGENSLVIQDTVENRGFQKEAVMMLYHMNFGFPLVDEDSRVLFSRGKAEVFADYSRLGESGSRISGKPIDGGQCDTYFFKPDGDGNACAALMNDRLGLGVSLQYSANSFPYLVEWRNLVSGDYSIALEPCTQYPLNRLNEKARENMIFLEAQEARGFQLQITVLDGTEPTAV